MRRFDLAVVFLAAVLACSCLASVFLLARYGRLPHVPLPQRIYESDGVVLGKSKPAHVGNAQYMLVEFTDYQCPSCRSGEAEVNSLVREFAGRVEVVYRQFPLAIHARAKAAAEAAEVARLRGRFAPMHEALMSADLSASGAIEDAATRAGFDLAKVNKEMRSGARARVEEDVRDGKRLGVRGTPTLFFILPDKVTFRLFSVNQVRQLVR